MATNIHDAVPATSRALASGRSGGTAALLVLLVATMLLAAWTPWGASFVCVVVLMIAFVVVLGRALTRRALGALINERKLMSLSRFQTVLWTILVVAGYFVIAVSRVKSGEVLDPLVVAIDWQLWALLGISTTALVGKLAEAFGGDGETPDAVERNREGVLYDTLQDARFSDVFDGDEICNAHLVDLGRLQMFFFTAIAGLVFAVQLFQLFAFSDLLASDIALPILPEGLLVLKGVSNTAYLANKAVMRTPSTWSTVTREFLCELLVECRAGEPKYSVPIAGTL